MSENEFCEKWPHFELWQGTRIPAIVVPILISTAFVAYKIYEKRNPRPVPAEPNPATEQETETSHSKLGDEEKGSNPQPTTPPKKTRLEHFLWFLLYWFDIQFTVHYVLKPSSLTPDLYWVAPLAALVTLAAGTYARWPTKKSPSDDDWALAMAWALALLKAQGLVGDHWYIYALVAGLGCGFVFPIPSNKFRKPELVLHYYFGWSCIFAYFVDGRIPQDSPVREYHFISSEAWPLTITLGIALLQFIWKWTTRFFRLCGQTDSPESLRKDAKEEVQALALFICGLAIFAALFVFTSFVAGSCIPWRYLVLHKSATTPSVTSHDSFIAGMVMIYTFAFMTVWKTHWNKWSLARFRAERWYVAVSATGYSILGLLLLATALWRWNSVEFDQPLRCVDSLDH